MGADERRGGPRLDLRLRVRFLDDPQMPEAEASDISPGGARLECRVPLDKNAVLRLSLDAGDGDPVEATATVAWCRQRKSMSLRKLFDVGVRFDTEWLGQKRGKLGRALGRIFSFSEFEPARAYERVVVTLRAENVDGEGSRLTVIDMSEGGMQLRADHPLGDKVHRGAAVIVEIPIGEEAISLDGEIVWVADKDDGDAAHSHSFGIQFTDPGETELAILGEIKAGVMTPPAISVFLPG